MPKWVFITYLNSVEPDLDVDLRPGRKGGSPKCTQRVCAELDLICRPVNFPCYHEASPYEEGDISIYSLRRKHVCLCLPNVLDLFAFVSFSLN